MGVSIDLHVYDYFDLVKQIKERAESVDIPEGRSVNFFVEKILPEFGVRAGDKFVTLWNEYYEDYNSGYELMHAVDLYFGTEDTYLGDYEFGSAVNAYELLEDMDIEPIGGEDE